MLFRSQLGSGSYLASGYSTNNTVTYNSPLIATYVQDTGIAINGTGAATATCYGIGTFTLGSSNTWLVEMINTDSGAGNNIYTAGAITLSGALDRLRFTTVNGTDTFDAGTVNVYYE